jgi:ATP-dependent Clp protease adapter protein ClpS
MSEHPSDRPPIPPKSAGQSRHHQVPRSRPLSLYRVILVYNAQSDLMAIVRAIMELTHLCRAEATHKMWESHHCGRSVVLTTHRERAELFVEQFAGRGITVTIEAV